MSFGVSVSGKENSYERYRTYRTERMLMLAELLGCERYINVDSHVYSVCVYPTPKHSPNKPRLTVPLSQLSRVAFSDCTRERNSEYETSGAHSSECGRREQHRWGSSVEIFDWVAPALGRAHIPRVTTWASVATGLSPPVSQRQWPGHCFRDPIRRGYRTLRQRDPTPHPPHPRRAAPRTEPQAHSIVALPSIAI